MPRKYQGSKQGERKRSRSGQSGRPARGRRRSKREPYVPTADELRRMREDWDHVT